MPRYIPKTDEAQNKKTKADRMTAAIASSLVAGYATPARADVEQRVYSPMRPSPGLLSSPQGLLGKDEILTKMTRHIEHVHKNHTAEKLPLFSGTMGAVPATARGPERGSDILG